LDALLYLTLLEEEKENDNNTTLHLAVLDEILYQPLVLYKLVKLTNKAVALIPLIPLPNDLEVHLGILRTRKM
jgi:hypothetical protein